MELANISNSPVISRFLLSASQLFGAFLTARSLGPGGRGSIVAVASVSILVAAASQGARHWNDLGSDDKKIPIFGGDFAFGGLVSLGALASLAAANSISWNLVLAGTLLTLAIMLESILVTQLIISRGAKILEFAVMWSAIYVAGLLFVWASDFLTAATATSCYVAATLLSTVKHGRILVFQKSLPRFGEVANWEFDALVATRIDRLVLAVVAGPVAAGNFSVVATSIELARPFLITVGIEDSGERGDNRSRSLSRDKKRSIRMRTVLYLSWLFAAIAIGPWLTPLILGDGFQVSRLLFVLLALAEIVYVGIFVLLPAIPIRNRSPKVKWILLAVTGIMPVAVVSIVGVSESGTAGSRLLALSLIIVISAWKSRKIRNHSSPDL